MLRMISLLGCLVLLMISLAIPSALAFNKVLSLNGDGDYVEIVDSPILNNLDTQVTIEMWIRCDRLKSGYSSIIYKGDAEEPEGANRSFALWLHSNGFIHFTSAPSGNGQLAYNTPSGFIHFYTWYHVVGIIDAVNQEMKILINGNEVATGNYGNSIRKSLLPLKIGLGDCCATFSGYIDEVRIWSVARTQTEIQETMNRPLTLDEIQSENLVGYWNFDDGTANDLSQYDNHGTLYGNAYIADVIYVSIEGNDETGDGTFDNPYRTIQQGINESGRNDIVQVLPGIYEENISLLSDLIVLGSGSENTTLTFESGNIVTAHDVHNVSLSGFTIEGQGSADVGFLCSGTTSWVEIRDNVITGAVRGIQCLDSASPLVEYNVIQQNLDMGILCSGSSTPIISYNDIQNNGRFGVECDSTSSATISHNTMGRNQNGVGCHGYSKSNIIPFVV